MSDSEESDNHDATISFFSIMQGMMISMLNEVDDSLEDLRRITHDIHHSQDLFTHLHIQETLQPMLQRWACEKRLTEDGLSVILTKDEQKELDLRYANTTIYAVCAALVEKKTRK